MKRLIPFLLVMSVAGLAIAQENTAAGSHPVLSGDSTWAGIMLILILGAFFLPAAVIGPIVRALTPNEVPPSAHDEPPGSSHHHGKSGTVDHNAPEHDQHHHH